MAAGWTARAGACAIPRRFGLVLGLAAGVERSSGCSESCVAQLARRRGPSRSATTVAMKRSASIGRPSR
ncbi:hypothetical protein DGM93_10575 [Xanthomonas phaseoli pv. phaseoli]|nr:hypothetical protein DGM93_10575 [Xanthomonas phaseoli pv. phaseoli]